MSKVDGLVSLLNTAEATQKLREILNVGVGQAKAFEAGDIEHSSTCFNFNGNSDAYSAGTRMLESLNKEALMDTQTIVLQGASESQSFDVSCQNVTVVVNPQNNYTSGSSKVRIKNIVDYGWEQKYYTGRLVATHLSGNFIAYSIVGRDKSTGMVRVLSTKSGERTLIKAPGIVKDLSFAHIADQVVLAFVDDVGHLYINDIHETDGKLSYTSVLTVTQPNEVPNEAKPSDNHRVIWCQYIPEENLDDGESLETENCSKLLVILHDDKAEMLNIDLITQKHGNGPIDARALYSGYQIITDHSQPIIDASFSPDGVALATASLDGEVKFFQVYLNEEEPTPRFLHCWNPHEGKPLSCLFFLDNHKQNSNADTHCWKFAVTGANFNREIKVWSCETWTCLQTINFKIPEGETLEPCFKAGLDLSATYLMLSDISRKVFYVLILKHDVQHNVVNVCSLSAFQLPFPILSYSVVDASRKKYKQSVDNEHIVSDFATGDQLDDIQDDEADNLVEGVVVRLFYIQPKSLQECRIAYQPNASVPFTSSTISSLSQDSYAFRDHISDMSFADTDRSQMDDAVLDRTPILSQTHNSNQILLTPDAFTSSPIHTCTNKAGLFQSPLNTPSSIPLPPVTPSEEAALATPTGERTPASADNQEMEVRNSGRSSNSSPSLEVQQILGPTTQADCDVITTTDGLDDFGDLEKIEHGPELENSSKTTNSFVSISPFNKQPSPNVREVREYDPTIWPLPPNLNSEINLNNNNTEKEIYSEVQNTEDYNDDGGGGVGVGVGGGGDGDGSEPCQNNIESQPSVSTGKRMEKTLDTMQESLHVIRQMLLVQQKEIADLKQEMRIQKNTGDNIHQEMGRHFAKNVSKLETTVSAMMERNLLQLKQCDNKWLEELMRNVEKREQLQRERFVSGLSQSLLNAVNSKLETSVKHEMKSLVLPAITKFLEPVKDSIQNEIAQKLTATDNVMKDNISKMVKSKSVTDAIGNSAALIMQQLVPTTYREMFQNFIMPSFDKACQAMFQQLNENFQRGTKEYIQAVETQLERRRRQNEQTQDPILSQLQTTTETFQATADQLSKNITASVHEELEKQLKTSILSLQDFLIQRIHQHIRNEIDIAMKEQKNVIGDSVLQIIRSRAVTPVPTPDPQIKQAQIMRHVRSGQYNSAFSEALSASDLSLVTMVCEAIPPEKIFMVDVCPLTQPILLSLIQQLSADLTSRTELKLKYLQDAVFQLDCKNPAYIEHAPSVLQGLIHKLQQFIQSNPSGDHCRHAKMLIMACQSVKN